MKKLFALLGVVLLGAALAAPLSRASDAKALYAKCQGCHGADGAKNPLGVGKPLKGMSAQEVIKAMDGYKAKTMGGEKKAIMEKQAEKLSDGDIKALAELIASF